MLVEVVVMGSVKMERNGKCYTPCDYGIFYELAIDPFNENIYTRGTARDDGGGWNIRFIHHELNLGI